MANGNRGVVTAGLDALICCWDADITTIDEGLVGEGFELSSVMMHDFDTILAGDQNGNIDVWSLSNVRIRRRLRQHQPHNCITSLCQLDEARCVSGSEDCSLIVWEVGSGEALIIIDTHTAVRCIAVTGAGCIVSGGDDGAIQVWVLRHVGTSVEDYEMCSRIEAHLHGVLCVVALGASQHKVATGGCDSAVKIWDLELGRLRMFCYSLRHPLCHYTLHRRLHLCAAKLHAVAPGFTSDLRSTDE